MTDCVNITVIFTDKSIKSYNLESRLTVISFKKIVANSHGIEHEKFFGFYYQDEQKNNYWLSDEKYICHYDIIKSSNFRTGLYFAFKYLVQFDYWISDAMTKRMFYHQLKQQLYDGDIVCDSDLCFKLLAMTLLLEDGKQKSCEEIQRMNIISAHLFAKHPSIDYCINQIICKYRQLESISKDEIRKRFIVHILELPYQLTHYFYAKNFNNSTIAIAINNNGFFEGEKCNRSSIKLTYAWSEITNITHHKSRVSIDIQDLRNRSSIRRKSSALSISYDLLNSNLAKSLVYLAKDTINFMSHNMEPMRIMSTTTPRRNPNNIKKNHPNYTYSGKTEKYRPSAQNTFITENDIMMSRSSSRISLTSSNYAGSCLTNDSASLLLDDELLNTPVNVPEKQKIFIVLYEKRKKIIAQLNEKVKDAVQNCLLEKSITKNMPSDYSILDPKSQIKLTKFAIRTQVSGGDMSVFQKKKNSIMEEIETLQNIIDKLKENEKKHRIEIKKKLNEINCCTKRLQTLEEEHARELYVMNNSRSNSEGCLFPYPNGNIPVINGHATVKGDSFAPMTEPRSRKNTTIYTDRSSSGTDTLKSYSIKYPRMKRTEDNYVNAITSPNNSPLKVDMKSSPNYTNNSQFQRFTSTRSQIKGLPSKFPISVIQKNASNSSVESNYSVDAPDPVCSRSSNSNTDSEYSEEPIVEIRSHSNYIVDANQGFRDSREITMNRAKISYKVSNMKLVSRQKYIPNNNPDRNSVSLEELREDISEASDAQRLFAVKPRRETFECPSFISKLTYHPSKKDGKPPIHITRGKQPSIIRKAARSNGSQDRL